jgi:C4-dicarboxylate transporter DctM subunit
MPTPLIGLICILLMICLIYGGMPIAIAMISTSFLGMYLIKGNVGIAGKMLAFAAFDSLATFTLAVVPLFVLMGMLVSLGGLAEDAFSTAKHVFRRIPGGVGIATVAANTVFAAITGVSLVSAAVFGKVAVPEMLRLGYQPRFSVGTVAGSSVLGMLIPPSVLLIFYAMLAEVSIGKMFIAGIVPGLVLASLFSAGILLVASFLPRMVFKGDRGAGDQAEARDQKLVYHDVLNLAPILLLVMLMLGGLYLGFFTPAESGAVGAVGALILVLMRWRLTFGDFWMAVAKTGELTASLGILLIGANIFTRMITLTRLPTELIDIIIKNRLSLFGVVVAVVVLQIFLGMIMDAVSNMFIALPIIIPVVKALNGDLIWFGIVSVVAAEVGLLTPPIGLSAFVVKSTLEESAGITLEDVFRGSFPFLLIMILLIVLLVLFPGMVYCPGWL